MKTELNAIHMASSELIRKEPLDYGGFGEIYLCYHKTIGQVVLKKVYTGPPRNEGKKQCLLEEGLLMSQLNHRRVVKLLGVVLEDGDYSLVMELIPKGNLFTMLQRVSVPTSIKGQIILEILEGMVYLTKQRVIHKDLKPENILVDNDFHIKIADLGLAICQEWSRLTKEESRRQGSQQGRDAGTLCYMAPEHLSSIHTQSTEKSDIFSFAVVVWVILTNKEPYQNARSLDHMCQCVCNGDRPDEGLIPDNTPDEMVTLMKRCWHQEPDRRPTFAEGYESFLPFYKDELEKHVASDLQHLMANYKGPEELVDKMRSLSVEHAALTADPPAPLRSSNVGPIEASMEDLQSPTCDNSFLQADATRFPDLSSKLDQELNYHRTGGYPELPDHSAHSGQATVQRQPSCEPPDPRAWEGLYPSSSVQSWTKLEAVQPSEEDPFGSLFNTKPRSDYSRQGSSQISGSGTPFPCPQFKPQCLQQVSWSDSGPLISGKLGAQTDQGHLVIQNASGIQIGHNNTLNIQSHDFDKASLAPKSPNPLFMELLQKYDERLVTEGHLDLLSENIGNQWKRCARRLGLTNTEVDVIDHDYCRDGLPEKVHQMLSRWRMKEGRLGCTVGRLCRAMETCVELDVLCTLLLTCSEAASP